MKWKKVKNEGHYPPGFQDRNFKTLKFYPVWFDSLGAKSMCVEVETPDVRIVIDPGIAAMQPGFPASKEDKEKWKEEGKRKIIEAVERADIIIISHYHHDHYLYREFEVYRGKILFVKNPNEYINASQRKRAVEFFEGLWERVLKKHLRFDKNPGKEYPDPMKELKLAKEKDFGDYAERKRELIKKGREWFRKRVEEWREYRWIPEAEEKGLRVFFPEGKTFRFGDTEIYFTPPLFHGIEFSRVGWIFATVIKYRGKKLLHTSDMNGPIIEDHAAWIIKENPDILVLDGPMTYMFGYMLNRINLKRAVENALRILRETTTPCIIYDHHLPREKRYMERTKEVWEEGKGRVMTAAEYLGKKPKVMEVTEN